MLAYDILDVTFSNDDNTIRNAYLKMVKKYPPETRPAEFKVIQKAYSLVKTESNRMTYFLFGSSDEITFCDYEIVKMNFESEKRITNEKWGRLCQIYQEQKY